MFCTKCGAEIAEAAQFCTACGAAITGRPAQAAPPQAAPEAVPEYAPPPPLNVPPPQQYPAQPYAPNQPLQQQININVQAAQPVHHAAPPAAKWTNMRLVVGIISIVFTFLIQLQACLAPVAAIFGDTTSSGDAEGILYVFSFFFLAAGFISAIGRRSRGAAIAAGCMYGLFALIALAVNDQTDTEFDLWYIMGFLFAALMIISGIAEKKRPQGVPPQYPSGGPPPRY